MFERIFQWFASLLPSNRTLYDWASADTAITQAEKKRFIIQASYVGGSILRLHPDFEAIQKDYLCWVAKRELDR